MPIAFRTQLLTLPGLRDQRASEAPHPILIIYDDRRAPLAPLDDLRPTFAIRTGALTTAERLAATIPASALILDPGPAHIQLTTQELSASGKPNLAALPADYENAAAATAGINDPNHPVIAINSRCPLPIDQILSLPLGSLLLDQHETQPTPAHVIAVHDTLANIKAHIEQLRAANTLPKLTTQTASTQTLLTRPWHWRRSRDAAITIDIELLRKLLLQTNAAQPQSQPQDVRIINLPPRPSSHDAGYPVTIADTANIWPGVTIDATAGPVVIDEHATVRPGATIIGPAYIGQHATVIDNALIKPHTAIGPVCKAAGEIGGTIFQGHANKAHEGHLGDSYLGEWVNLGAGTTNSNLLNTYTQVIAQTQPNASKERTGEVYLGCILADHVKTAICTRIMTGAIAHTGTMWAATAPLAGTIPRFRWITDTTGPAGQPFRIDKFIETARTVMARRNIEPSDQYLSLLRTLDIEQSQQSK